MVFNPFKCFYQPPSQRSEEKETSVDVPDTDLSLLLFHVCFTIKMWSDFTNEETGLLGGFKRASTSSWRSSVFESGNLITGEPQLLTE